MIKEKSYKPSVYGAFLCKWCFLKKWWGKFMVMNMEEFKKSIGV